MVEFWSVKIRVGVEMACWAAVSEVEYISWRAPSERKRKGYVEWSTVEQRHNGS